MIFQTDYYTPMDRGYLGNNVKDISPDANIEQPIVPIKELGQSVTEGRQFGTLIQSSTAAIRAGAGQIELQPGMGGGEEPLGVESYGKDAREALRELAKVNEITFSSVHTPPQIGNMSGFNPQQGGFSDEYRKKEIEEVRAAILFAAETTQGGAVVVHTGEFQRPMFDAPWNKQEQFKSYEEEPERAIKPLVDIRTGKTIQEVRMNQLVPRAVWNRYEEGNEFWEKHNGQPHPDDKGNIVKPGDYIDYEGRVVVRAKRVPVYDEENNTFLVHREKWGDLVKEAEDRNEEKERELGRPLTQEETITPEEAFLHATTETQEAIARGWAGNYGSHARNYFRSIQKYKEALEFYKKLEGKIPKEELWKIERQHEEFGLQRIGLVPFESKRPTEIIKDALRDAREGFASVKEMVTGQLQSAEDQKILREHAVSASKYAIRQSMKSYAEAGIEAMQQSDNNPHAQRDIFVAPENIFPDMGYGSHPEELRELVQNARKKMLQYLTEKQIEDPAGRTGENGHIRMVDNPYYTGMDKKQAEKEARDHIKATLDTQHMGMWFNNFKQEPGETRQLRKKRFDKWYLQEVEKLSKEDIVGNIHLVDSVGGSHQHLPAGQGDLPLKETLKILKKNGFRGTINSEGHGEERFGQGRILLETWKEFGTPIYGMGGYGLPGMPSQNWSNVYHGYFGRTYPPYFIHGAYSPSNEWTLWSEVPME